ncbi:MAG: CoA ester lyase [Anaerolineaceae bacterium]|nr:CoA ester lyase [Anaerolineaceae bacterium]
MAGLISRARRALMYVPGNDERKISKAAGLNADGIILDLEDGVSANRKDEARVGIQKALQEVNFGRSERLVRINSLASGRAMGDLLAVMPGKPDAILIPKADSAAIVQEIDSLITEMERDLDIESGRTAIILTIESARAFLDLQAICRSSQRVEGLVFGAEDFTADTGITRTLDARELLYARSQLVMHAAAFGFNAIDMVQTNYSDLALLERECREGAELGFTGKQVIHPAQVEIVQAAFTPSAKLIEYARRVMEAAQEAMREGKGAFSLDGQMVDTPVIKRAEKILARARAAGTIEQVN